MCSTSIEKISPYTQLRSATVYTPCDNNDSPNLPFEDSIYDGTNQLSVKKTCVYNRYHLAGEGRCCGPP